MHRLHMRNKRGNNTHTHTHAKTIPSGIVHDITAAMYRAVRPDLNSTKAKTLDRYYTAATSWEENIEKWSTRRDLIMT